MPLGFVPPKVPSRVALPSGAACVYGPAGAGGAKTSTAIALSLVLVGLNVPLVSPLKGGIAFVARSSSVIVRLLTGAESPTSDQGMRLAPFGPTRSISTSRG